MIMHNLHFILIKADSAAEAASEAENAILDWGNENNWRTIEGVASEDGSDDINNHEGGRWGLTFLDDDVGISKEGTYFSRAVAYLNREIMGPLTDLPSKLQALSDTLRAFDPQVGSGLELERVGHELQQLSELVMSRDACEQGKEIPELREWQFDQFGLTDMTDNSEGARRYLVFLDMHS
jgi:hypothetical protein